MTDQWFTVNSRKYDTSLSRSWRARLIGRPEESIVLEGFFEQEVSHPHLGLIEKGTRSVETFYFDRWYNWFAFYNPSGTFRNYYINISTPPKVGLETVDYVDLDIDVIVWPNGKVDELDIEEFRLNAERFSYPTETIRRVMKLKEKIKKAPSEFLTPLPASI